MNRKKVGFIFPAFAMKFTGSHPQYQEEMDRLSSVASKLVPVDLKRFREMASGIIEDELQAHYFCYINSGVVSTILKTQNIIPDYLAGYSMGLFSALFCSQAVSFEEGLLLMHNYYNVALHSIDDKKYGVGIIVGLTTERVDRLIGEHCKNVDIIDVSNEHVINVSGFSDEVAGLLKIAAQQALHTKMLPITLPYHSRFMERAKEEMGGFLKDVKLETPAVPIVSCVNQKVLSTAQDLRDELYCNVSDKINWHKTMKKMLDLGVDLFVECGMSKSLTQLAKFIGGKYTAVNISTLSRLSEDQN
jgi:malonyl CoA-acyl carrier protein transacylase